MPTIKLVNLETKRDSVFMAFSSEPDCLSNTVVEAERRFCSYFLVAAAGRARKGVHAQLGEAARELTNELYPNGLPRGARLSVSEAVAGALGDEINDWPEEELRECAVCDAPARKASDKPAYS
jgi:hypothetical protein